MIRRIFLIHLIPKFRSSINRCLHTSITKLPSPSPSLSRSTSTTEWDEFIQITANAAQLIPLDDLDLSKYQSSSLFSRQQSVSVLETLRNLKHKHRGYIMYTIINIYKRQNNYQAVKDLFEMMSVEMFERQPRHGNTQNLINFKSIASVSRFHLKFMDSLVQGLQTDFDFMLLRLQLLAVSDSGVEVQVQAFEDIFVIQLNCQQVLLVYRLMMQVYAVRHHQPKQIVILLERLYRDHGVQVTPQEYVYLFQAYSNQKDYESLFVMYRQLGGLTNDRIINYVMRAYCAQGYIRKAEQLMHEHFKDRDPGLHIYTTLLAGYCSGQGGGVTEAMGVYNTIIQRGFIPDRAVYHTIMHGYAKESNYSKTLEWLGLMRRAGFESDMYTHSILQNCKSSIEDQVEEYPFARLGADDELGEKVGDVLQIEMAGLDGPTSHAVRILSKMRGNRYIRFAKIINMLDTHPLVKYMPELYTSILARLILGKSRDVAAFLDHMTQIGIPISAKVYSFLILMCYKTKNLANQAWEYHETMKEQNLHADENVYRFLMAVGIKTNDISRMKILVNEILNRRLTPLSNSLLHDLIRVLTNMNKQSRPGLNYQDASDTRLIYPFREVLDVKAARCKLKKITNLGRDTTLAHYSRFAIRLLQRRLENGIPPTHVYRMVVDAISISHHSLDMLIVVYNIAINLDSTLTHDIAVDVDSHPNEQESFVKIFFDSLFQSNHWIILNSFVLGNLMDPESKVYQYLTAHIINLGSTKNSIAIYTLRALILSPMHHTLEALLVEQLGIICLDQVVSREYWKLLPSIQNEEIVWAQISCLIWWGCHEEAVDLLTIGLEPSPEFTGLAVHELRRWLRMKGLDELDGQIVRYWQTRIPEWVNNEKFSRREMTLSD